MAPGARSKFGAPMFETGPLETNVRYWRKYLWHSWGFSTFNAVIRRPPQWFGESIVIRRGGNCAPHCADATTFPPIYLYSCSPHPLYIGMLFPTVFVVVFMLISPDVDLKLFITFITTCKTSSIKIWFVLAAGLAENLIQVVFRQPFVIQHVRTRLLSCKTWNFLFFIFFYHYIIN